jgi:hypothetical protein
MTVTVEPVLVMIWTYDQLAPVIVGAHVTVVPVKPTLPFPRVIIETPTSRPDTNALQDGAALIWASPDLQVSVVGDDGTPWQDLEVIAGQVYDVLNGIESADVVGRGQIVTIERTLVFTTVDETDVKQYPKIVQMFACNAKAA